MGLSLTANNTDSVEEARVVTDGGKAEYGRSAGAQVQLVTRSGTNNSTATLSTTCATATSTPTISSTTPPACPSPC